MKALCKIIRKAEAEIRKYIIEGMIFSCRHFHRCSDGNALQDKGTHVRHFQRRHYKKKAFIFEGATFEDDCCQATPLHVHLT